jgi:hypothetical protein
MKIVLDIFGSETKATVYESGTPMHAVAADCRLQRTRAGFEQTGGPGNFC